MLTSGQSQIAQLLYSLATQHGASPQHAREFAAASMAESGLNPRSVNRSSGATGLFQLLSQGYRQTAQRLGGLNNPRANALAILPDYLNYWRSHPGAAPGQAGAAVERSGEGAGFYARPLSQLGQLGGGPATPSLGVRPHQGFATIPGPPQPPLPPQGPDPTAALRQLMSLATQRSPDYQPLFQQIQADKNAPVARAPLNAPTSAALTPLLSPTGPVQGRRGKVSVAAGADRAGVNISNAVMQFVGKLAGFVGHALTIGTGTNHNRMTVNGNVSDHWSGHAADIPATGQELLRLGRLALIAAGANPTWAMRQHGGLYNVGGHQIIFLTNEGGNHFNHLHVSAY